MAFRDSLKKYRETQGSQTTNSSASSTTPAGTNKQSTSQSGSGSSFRDSLAKYRASQSTGSIQGWGDTSVNLINDIQTRSQSWFDNSEYLSQYDRITAQLATADAWRKKYAGNDEAIAYIDSVVDALTKAKNYSFGNYQFYSQFENENSYNAWYKKESFIRDYLANPEKATSTYDYEADWLEEAEHRAETNKVKSSEDFEANSRYVSTKTDDQWTKLWSQYGLGYGDLTYEYINNQQGIRDEISSKSRAFRADTKDSESTFEEKHYDYMTDDEVSIYNYYYSKFGKDKAEQYLDSIGGTLEARANNQTIKNVSEFASEYPFISSALSIGTSVGSGFEYIGDVIEYGKDKVLGNPARLGTNEAALMTNTVRGTVSELVDWEIGNWDAFDFLYSTAMSGADSLVAGTMFGNWGGAVLGLSAAAQGTNDALNRGMNDGQAFWNGLISGVFEGLFETVSIGNFNKLKEIAPGSVKEIFKNLGKSMLVNASEETLTEIANIGYDTLINGEFANYTWEELKNGAWREALVQILEAGASGALMGIGMSGIGNAIGYSNGNQNAKQIYGSDPGALVGEALEINPNNAFAQKMQGRLDSGKQLSGGQLNRLVQQNEAALTAQDTAAIQNAAESRLTELGETGDVSAIAAALTKQAAGEKLSKTEQQLISSSRYGQRVANELNTKNIRSGEYSSTWAENIGTKRINTDEYSRLVEAAQQSQETAEVTGEQVVAEMPKKAQAVRTAVVEDPAANGQQITDKLTGKETLQVAEEPAAAEDGKTYQISNGKEATPKKVTSISRNDATIQLEGGEEVSAEDIAFGTESENLLWRTTLQISNMTPSAANAIILEANHRNTSMESYIQGAAVVFRNGYNNTEINPEYAAKLTAEQRDIIYEAGRLAAEENATKEQAQKKAANKKAATEKSSATVKKGSVYYGYEGQSISERVSSGKSLNAKQSVGIQFAERLAKSRGITFYFYESYVDENGDRVYKDKDGNVKKAENGFYDPSDGSIHVDLNAGYDGKGTVLFTISHELVHFIKDWSPKHFRKLADILMQGYRQKNVPVDTLVKLQQTNAQEHGRELSYDEAYEEVIADSMETILADGKVMELMRDIEKADKSLRQKIKEFFQDIVKLLKDTINAYRGVDPDTVEGTLVSQMNDLIAELQQVFAEGVYEAGDNYRKTEKNTTADDGDRIMFDSRISELADGDILELIENCNRGEYALRTFIPVRKDTPSILLEKSKLDGLKPLDNRPVIMLVEHVQQCMDDDVAAIDGKRGHALTAQNILDITKALDDPRYIFYQQDNGKYSLIVEYNIGKRNEKGMAIVDVTRDKNPDQMNGFEGGKYNILVTAYAPDSSYLRKYIRSENNRCIYDKIEDASQRSSGSLVPSLLNDSSSIPTLTQPQTVVKENDFAKSDKVKMSARKGETAKKALSHFGRTFSWKETGYLLTDGAKLDFSGRHEGASGGYRSVDHRDILDAYPEDTELDGNGAMVDFMSQGNIRIMPEGDGINLQVQPTKAQEQALDDFISRARGEVTLDIDDAHGNTVVSVEYPRGTRATKVLQDIKNYFENGIVPAISELAKFHYSTRKKLNASVIELLQQENEKLKEDVQHLKDLLKLQRTVTGGTKFTKTSVEAAARMLKNGANARGDTAELAKLLNTFYEGIATDKELSWESVREMANPAVEWLQIHTEVKPEQSEYAKDILSHLRTSRIYLDNTQMQEATYRYGSYDAYRKMTMGSIILAKEGSVSLDSKWQELSAMYPDVFDADISSSDMPEALIEAIGRLRDSDTSILEYEYSKDVIAQDLLRKLYDSYWRVSTLRTFADSKQREINRLKAQHYQRMDKLRSNNAAQIEQLKEEHRAAVERINSQHRQQMENQQQAIRQQYQESRKNAAESRKKTLMRQKIRKVIRDLDKILNRGNKKTNVKEDMKDFVSKALASAEVLFTDTYTNEDMIRNGVGTELTTDESRYIEEAKAILREMDNLPFGSYEAMLQRRDVEEKLKGKLAYRISKLGDVFVRERARLNKTQVSEVLGNLADAYAKLETAEHSYVNGAYHEAVYEYLKMLQEDVGGTKVIDMTLGQLEELHKAYTMVLTTVRNANKMFAENLKQTREQLGSRAIDEIRRAGGERGLWAPGEDKINAFLWNNQKPIYAFERIGSETLTKLFENTRTGEDGWAQDMTEAREYYLEKVRKYKYDSWDFEKQYNFTSTSGLSFSLNLEQIMSLYAYSKREQAHDHLMKGGFVFDGNTEVQVSKMGIKMTYLNKTAKAYNVTLEILEDIISKLTLEQRGFVDEMQDYLSATMGEKGNEVSMQMYGVKLFNEEYYFPLRSAGQYMERAKEADLKKQQGQISIVNSGFAKATTPKSSNPVVLSGFMDVWADHVNEMSMYHSFVLPMEDFRRVYNYSSPNMETGQSVSVNSVIQDAYGEAATSYIDQLYRDLNGGAVSDPRENWSKALMGKFKKAAVFSSLSVVIQQPSAIGRAFAIIDPKYFIGSKVDSKRHKALWAELKKYAPVAAIKEMGYFDTGIGKSAQDYITGKEYNTLKEKAVALVTDENYRDELLSKAPALADELTWCAIWEATKRETKVKNPKMDVRSDEFLQLAGKRFTEVITKTQVYDSVLSRSANMRSKGAFMSMWTAFMAEPTTTINIVEDALRKGKKGDKKYAARAMGAVLSSVIINSVLSSLIYAMRDDDEDETFLEKYVQSFTTEILDGINPLTYYPFLKDVWSALQGYDIERSDMSLITSLIDAGKTLLKVYLEDTEDMDEEEQDAHNKRLAEAWWGLVDYVTAFTGVPVKNVRRDINAGINTYKTISLDLTNRDTSWGSLIDKTLEAVMNTIPVVGLLSNETTADKLYKATVSGDAVYQKRLASSYQTENSLNNAIRKGLRTNDSRIWEAAIAWNNNDLETYMSIAKEIIAEGNFSQDNVVAAIQAEAAALAPDDGETTTTSKAKGYFTMEKFAVAISQGNKTMAAIIKADIIETAQKNGKTAEEAEDSFASSAKSRLKELFVEGGITASQAINALTNHCGVEEDDAQADILYWDFLTEYPEYSDLSEAAVAKYYEYAASAGISADVYYDYYVQASRCEGDKDADGNTISGSKKAKIMAVIDALSITRVQKDALYYANGWAESKIYEAPWH